MPQPVVTVRPALHRDISVLTGMARALAETLGRPPDAVDKDAIAALLFGPDRWADALIAIDRDHRALGYVTLSRVFEPHNGVRSLWLGDFYVMASARGAGVGRALIQAAAKRALSLKCAALTSDVGLGNEAARAFFAKSPGFADRSVEPWRADGEDLRRLADGD